MNTEEFIKRISNLYGNSKDIITRTIKIKKYQISYLFFESVCSDDKISDFLMRSINYIKMESFKDLFSCLKNSLNNSKVEVLKNESDLFTKLSSGYTAIVCSDSKDIIVVETKLKLDRGITESTTEQIIRGPKDSFTENHMINLGLIRKRIKDPNLWFEDTTVGVRTKTKVTLGYINDVVIKSRIYEIKNVLNKIDVDGIIDSGQIRDYLKDNNSNFFPTVISTERPDLVCNDLLDGKIAIIVENSPFVLLLPSTLVDFFHSSEDYYQKSANVTFSRILRFAAFLISILTPALYIAVTTFNHQVIPDKLLISLAVQRSTVPFPTAIEIIVLLTTFELLKESDIRTPSVMGTAISIVGALVLGDAAVSAGIVSPIVVIVVAITSVSGLLFTDIDIINGIRWYRLLFIVFSSIAGLIGFTVALVIFITKLSSVEILNVPFLTPFSPLNFVGQNDALFKKAKNKVYKRPSYLSKNLKNQGDL